ncbi:MAG: CsiV family protein [Woeseiaceae bacterium]|nr:CsiV family protein [Woeseiaceae bacterium]
MRYLIPSLLSLLLLAPALAQQPEADEVDTEEQEIRRYTVEVIVFRYTQEVSTGSEVFLPDEPEPEPALEAPVEFVQALPPETVEIDEPEPLPDTEFVLMAEADYELINIFDRMENLDVYEPVMHFGWTQATWPEEQTEAVPLARFAEPPEDLDGTLMLYQSRFLHLVVDLAIRAPDAGVSAVGNERTQRQGSVRTVGDLLDFVDDEDRRPLPTYFRIQEDRIVKRGELRYYDHPKFGVIARVTRVEEDVEDASGDGELLGYGTE